MTQLSGTLEGVGLPAIVRFLSGLYKTGCLHVVHEDWHAVVFFDTGGVTSARLGSRRGLSVLDVLVQALPGGNFTFDGQSPAADEENISLSTEALLTHLDEQAALAADDSRRLPTFDAVPVLLVQDDSSSSEEALPLDRSTLQTLLAVDGQRTVREIVAQRGSLDALWQLAKLVEMGLIGLTPTPPAGPRELQRSSTVPPSVEPPPPPQSVSTEPSARAPLNAPTTLFEPPSAETAITAPSPVVPMTMAPTSAAEPLVAEPHFAETISAVAPAAEHSAALPVVEPPAAEHSAALPVVEPPAAELIAAAAVVAEPPRVASSEPPRPINLEVIADEAPAHCPMLGFEDDPGNAFSRPTRLHRCFAAGTPLPLSLDQQRELCLSEQFSTCPRLTTSAFAPPAPNPRAASNRPAAQSASEPDDSRIVHLPLAGRTTGAERDAVADRLAVGRAEPKRLRIGGWPVRENAPTQPTPLRSRFESSNRPHAASGALAEALPAVIREPRPVESPPIDEAIADVPLERRFGGFPVRLIAVGTGALILLALIVYVLGQNLGVWFGDDSIDPALQPNTSAAVAGTPAAEVTTQRPTPVVARAITQGSEADAAAKPGEAVAPKPTSSGAASTVSAAIAPAVPTLSPASPTPGQPVAVSAPAQPAAITLIDESFTNNDRGWPSSAQGTAFLSNGSYRLTPRQAGQFVAIGAPLADKLKDVVVNATFHKVSGPPGGGYGLIVRDQAATPQNGSSQDGHYYVLEVGDKGEIGMWRRDADHWVDLLPWQASPAVKPDTGSNDVSVRAIGSRLTLSVNGTQVASKTDDTFSAGGVGLFVGGDGNQVAVDRFSIQTP